VTPAIYGHCIFAYAIYLPEKCHMTTKLGSLIFVKCKQHPAKSKHY